MKKTFALWRLYLRNYFSFRERGCKVHRWLLLLLLPSIIGFLTLFYQFFAGIYQALPSHQAPLGLLVAVLSANAIVLLFGLFYLLSAFFFAEDTERLLPLPLRPWEISGAKFLTILVNEYITLLPLLLPAFAAWWQFYPAPLFWLKGVLVFLFVPVIPLSAAGAIALVVMRFVNLPKGRDFWRVVGILISLLIAFAIQYLAMGVQRGITQEELLSHLLTPGGLVDLLGRNYPPALWAVRFLVQNDFLALVGFVLFSAAAAGLFLFFGQLLFFKGVVGGGEVSGGRRKAAARQRVRSVLGALLWREIALVVRNPVFLTNSLINLFLPPVILFFLWRSGTESLPAQVPFAYLELGAAGYIASLPVLSVLPSTAISREGKQFWLSRLIPVPPKLQLLSKLLASSLATFLGGVVGLVMLRALFPIPLEGLLLALFIGFWGSLGVGELALLVDGLWPNLEWTDPQKAMKGNLTGLYAMLLGGLYLGILAFLVVKLLGWGVEIRSVFLCLFVLFSFGNFAFGRLLGRQAPRVYWQER